jgi:cell division protein FtsL
LSGSYRKGKSGRRQGGRALLMTALVLVGAGIAVLYCVVRIYQLERENERLRSKVESLQNTISQKDAELGDLQVRIEILEKGTVRKETRE